ncbi:MAG: excalibur calcium-binding domain-containing protein [Pseudolysinimonas sp.]
MKRISLIVGALAVVILAPAAVVSAPAVGQLISTASTSGAPASQLAGASLTSAGATTFKNCTALNKKYPHGVGKPGAHDKVRGSTKPVTNFTVSASLYKANRKSDRDGDGVACEKL